MVCPSKSIDLARTKSDMNIYLARLRMWSDLGAPMSHARADQHLRVNSHKMSKGRVMGRMIDCWPFTPHLRPLFGLTAFSMCLLWEGAHDSPSSNEISVTITRLMRMPRYSFLVGHLVKLKREF